MANFQYTALDARGQETSGTIEAASDAEAVDALKQHGLYPTAVSVASDKEVAKAKSKSKKESSKKSRGGSTKGAGKKIPPKNIMTHTRQLATLIGAGLPLIRSLEVLERQEPNASLKNTVNSIADSVSSGTTYSEALSQHPKVFNKLFINMVKAGELGGVLELVLDRLAEYMEKADKLKNKIMSAATYPVIVLILAALILLFLMIVIVPKFTAMFAEMGLDLNPFSKFVFTTSDLLIKPELSLIPPVPNVLFLIVFVVLFGIIFVAWKKTAGGKKIFDKVILKIPLLGDISLKSSVSRFARTLGTLVTSGVPILQALNITRETTDNAVVANAIGEIHDNVKEGESVTQPMRATEVFPDMVVSMVDVGEETGQLPDMLLKVADVYEDEVDNAVTGLTAIVEPLMIVFLALVVGCIVIALFLPMTQIIEELQK